MPQPTAFQKQRIMRRLRDQDASNTMPMDGAGAPTDGVTGAGIAGIGCLYIDTNSGNVWVNEGTLASPVWGFLGEQVTT